MIIIFDLDGTLINSSARMYKLFTDLIPDCKMSQEEYWDYKRSKLNHEAMLLKFFPDYSFDAFNKKWLNKIEDKEYLDMDSCFPDTKLLLEQLKRSGITIILLTARQSKENLYAELEKLGIKKYFYKILVTEGKYSKSQLLEQNIDKLIIDNETVLFYLSDMGADILLGKKYGFKTIAITHGFMNSDCLSEYNPDVMVDELYEIMNYISLK